MDYIIIQASYLKEPYLSYLSDDVIKERMIDFRRIVHTLNDKGEQVFISQENEENKILTERYFHTKAEMKRRNLTITMSFGSNSLTNDNLPRARDLVTLPLKGKCEKLSFIKSKVQEKRPHLVKFGRREYLERRSFKVSLASSFNDALLNKARKDNELSLTVFSNPANLMIKDQAGREIKPISPVLMNYDSNDYYIFCSSYVFDIRLFSDFDADSCLFIYDLESFHNDMLQSMSKHINIKSFGFGPVSYIDPVLDAEVGELCVCSSKDIKYIYQKEFRHVFFGDERNYLPENIYLDMPQTKSYTEVFSL
ncbi:hypothetical protein CRN53_17690 [Vibrio vulnificus]|nr:hypothetical protein [Vibrio vulnificus]POB89784.1 hypothetical protein CRN53_17690 [Vibrio vulnificus]